ncbi:MAG: F0F1 ATP synthase subunit delta [Pseudomonadota bacterium]
MPADAARTVRPTPAAERYAEALFDLAKGEGALDDVEKNMRAIQNAIGESADFRAFLKSPVYAREQKSDAIEVLANNAGYHQLTKNFLGLLAQKGRLFALDGIAVAFLAMAAKDRGEVEAEATAAAPLDEEQVKRLRSEIEAVVGKAVNLETNVDPELLGGLVVKVGSTMIDTSLRTKLDKLKLAMKEA